jgi:hypothetical protein
MYIGVFSTIWKGWSTAPVGPARFRADSNARREVWLPSTATRIRLYIVDSALEGFVAAYYRFHLE